MQKQYFDELIRQIKKGKLTKQKLSRLKIRLCPKYNIKNPPTDIEILMNAPEKDIPTLRKSLLTKPGRTISGVSVVAVMTRPIKCPHGKCIMCPGGPSSTFGDVPQSYTGKEPATRRAIRNNYDPYRQVFNRLEQYAVTGHPFDKIELIIMGGTFPSFPKRYRDYFITYSLKAMNDFSSVFFNKGNFDFVLFKRFFELPGKVGNPERAGKIRQKCLRLKGKSTLQKEQSRNERSNVRCVGLTIETRPDYGRLKHGNDMLRLGATRVELGIQSADDSVLKKIKRGHTAADSIDSIRTLKDLGFKLNFHVMPGLPGTKDELRSLNEIFSNPDFRPDMMKIYPCMVLKGTGLHGLWKKGKYKPLTTRKAARLIAEFKRSIPPYCRIMRVQRDIPSFMTEAGVDRTNLRQYVSDIMEAENVKCRCIRCREIGQGIPSGKMEVFAMHYSASKGNEFFISAEKAGKLLGFCRLRLPYQSLRKEITAESGLVRELHVYGSAAEIGKKGKVQHKGIGRMLLSMAEDICSSYYRNKVVVISGIGVRGYYRKLGYRKEGPYMAKSL